MNRIMIATLGTLALGTAGLADARPSTHSEFRGYDQCMKAADRDSNGLVATHYYFIDQADEVSRYYINATRWEEGERNSVRITCETSRNGSQLLSSTIAEGRYTTGNPVVRVELAEK